MESQSRNLKQSFIANIIQSRAEMMYTYMFVSSTGQDLNPGNDMVPPIVMMTKHTKLV